MAALEAVDFVIPFSEQTPESLISEILPDVLVKGNDYLLEQIAGYKAVTDNGGSVIAIPLVTGYSTSNIVDKIRRTI